MHLPSFNLLGSVPSHLFLLSSLHSLNLSNTSLSGHIPPSIANLSRLTVLDLSHNPLLTGSFPSLLPPNLQYLDLSYCSLHGFISLSITNASSVKELYINHNLFSSFTPNGMASMAALQILDASSNLFNGSIPQVLFNCTNLRSLNLDCNHVGGLIPSDLGKLSDLENLRLQRNHFTGSIPHEIGNCKQMRQIWLDDNSLNGSIPEVLGELPLLTALSLANNSLEGLFPEAIFRCTSLSFLSLRGNMLSGDIPAALGSLQFLKVLLLANNNFSGFIPFQFGCLRQLQVLDVSTNRLEGPILCQTPHDHFHGAWRNQFTSFSRRLPWETHIRFGKILCNCSSDARENLSQSISKGWLWRMSEFLQFLDVDKGMQKAYLPCFLRTLQSLHMLGLTSNSLTKSIPRALAFLNLPYLGLSTNNILQDSVHGHHRHILQSLQSHDGNGHGPNTNSPIIMGVLAGVGVFCASLLLVGLVVVCRVKLKPWYKRRFGQPAKLPSLRKFRRESSKVFDPTLASISMRELVKATDDFDPSNVIGDGGFGLVFCATLSDGRTVAVKKLETIGLQGKREFEAEMETLGNIKHKNLVELLAYCKVGDERVLVYEFVEKGSLDTWLHERDDGPMVLDWKKRLRIAQGGARGLSYLHNDCNPFVIHRDIKSSNILLGKDFEPQIADFGLARNMSHMVSHVSTDAAGTMGYMAPEYSMTMGATKQADVYSFGMVMLELASRRRPNLLVQEKSFRTLAKWARHMLELGNHMDLLDPVFKKNPPPSDQVLAYFMIACDCVSDLPHHRPTINEAYEKLSLIGVGIHVS